MHISLLAASGVCLFSSESLMSSVIPLWSIVGDELMVRQHIQSWSGCGVKHAIEGAWCRLMVFGLALGEYVLLLSANFASAQFVRISSIVVCVALG